MSNMQFHRDPGWQEHRVDWPDLIVNGFAIVGIVAFIKWVF